MRRGTNVGRAYVEGVFDGSGMNDDIVDSVDGAEDGVGDAGDRHGERYGDEFGESLRERLEPIMDRLGNTLSRRLSRNLNDGMRSTFDSNRTGGIASRLGEALSDRVEETLAGIEDRINDMVSGNSGSGGGGGGGRGGNRFFQGPDPDDWNRLIQMAYSMNERYDQARTDEVRAERRRNEAADRMETNMLAAAHRMNLAFDRARTRMLAEAYRLNDDFDAGRIGGDGRATGNGGGRDSDWATRIGRMFGAGSRNNLLNIIGKSITNLINLQQRFASGITKITGLGGEGASTFSKFAVGLTATGAAGTVTALIMGVLASVFSALLAIVTALASTIVSGLVGALIVAGGAMGSVLAIGGLLTVMFTSLTDAQKEFLGNTFAPVKDVLTGLGQVLWNGVRPALAEVSANFQSFFNMMGPLASVMGRAFGQAGTIISGALNGPGFQKLFQALTVWLPGITTKLSSALGGFLNGLAGTFAAILPFVDRFATYLSEVADRFSNWANSASGQNAIVDFTERALTALTSLWGFTKQFFGFLGDVLFNPESQAAGNTIFDGMARAFARLRDSISDGSLKKWFQDGIDFGRDLWDAIKAVYNVFKAMANSDVLRLFGKFLQFGAWQAELLADVLGPLIDLIGWLIRMTGKGLNPILEAFGDLWGWIADKVEVVIGGIRTFRGEFNDLKRTFGMDAGNFVDIPGLTSASAGFDSLTASVERAVRAKSIFNSIFSFGSTAPSTGSFLDPFKHIFDSVPTLTEIGSQAQAASDVEWQNPYKAWAESIVREQDSTARAIRDAMREANKSAAEAMRSTAREFASTVAEISKSAGKTLRDAINATSSGGAISALREFITATREQSMAAAEAMRETARSTAETMRASAASAVDTAQSAVNSAAQALASATSQEDASAALVELHQAQAQLAQAQSAQASINSQAMAVINDALAAAEQIRTRSKMANAIMRAQQQVTPRNVKRLLKGLEVESATLADYARARAEVARRLEDANAKLADAISMRDDYANSVESSIKSFGDLLTAQARTIDGVEQALTSRDITKNLRERLAQIQAFQKNLRILLARGLNDSAYQQLLAGGVEQGGAFAEALVAGGQTAVNQTNSLTSQIDRIASTMGIRAGREMYQAGVDAAKGLVEGLESMSKRLDSAADRLGKSIAAAVKRALGINSPSRVMMGLMDNVGDGTVKGLDNQSQKVQRAANRLASNIPVAPSREVARYAASRGTAPVSGNSVPLVGQMHVHTPTEDPKAVAVEAVNELVGKL